MPDFDLSVVIVNFRTPDLVKKCVKSIVDLKICQPDKIFIVDNFSEDGSSERLLAELPDCRHVTMTENHGYSAGLNAGVKQTATDFVLCLNPDTYFTDNTIDKLADIFSEYKNTAIVGLDLRYPSGERQFSARHDYSLLDILIRRTPLGKLAMIKPINDRHLMVDAWSAESFEADWVIGTGFAVRRSAFVQVGGMDEGYFLYMEDVDLCLTLRKNGWSVRGTSLVSLVHDHQRASAKSIFGKSSRIHLESLWYFYKKHGMRMFHRR